jgi:hypothetical protein
MSTYNDASLIYYPSGYKAGTAYSLKPTDGSGDLTFTRASTATRVNESGLIEEVAANVPRLDNSQGGCSTLLLEPQRTNLVLRSDTPATNSWGNVLSERINLTYANDATISDDINVIAASDTLVNNQHRLIYGSGYDSPYTGTKTYSLSAKIKANGIDELSFLILGDTMSGTIDLINGTNNVSSSGTQFISCTTTLLSNGYVDIEIVWSKTNATSAVPPYIILFHYNGGVSYLGDGGGTKLYGVQIELGSYPTSYIPTTTTAVTRVGENSLSGVLPTIVNDFTFFVDFVRYGQYANSGVYNFAVKNSTNTDIISIYKPSSVGNLNVAYKIGGVTTIANIGASVGNFVHHKIAFVCSGTTVKVFKDGALVDTKTGFLNSDLLTDIHLRTESVSVTNEYGSKFQSILFYLSALTDTELETLTTL